MKWADKTRGGAPVKVFMEDTGDPDFPILGAIFSEETWDAETWTANGKCSRNHNHPDDLVAYQEKKPWTLETVPVPFPILRHKTLTSLVAISSVGTSGISLNNKFVRFDELFADYLCTMDGKTWQECGV